MGEVIRDVEDMEGANVTTSDSKEQGTTQKARRLQLPEIGSFLEELLLHKRLRLHGG